MQCLNVFQTLYTCNIVPAVVGCGQWHGHGLKCVSCSDLDLLIQCAFLSNQLVLVINRLASL